MFFLNRKYQVILLLLMLTVSYSVNAKCYIFDEKKLGGNFQIIVYSSLSEDQVNQVVNNAYILVDSLNVILSNYDSFSEISLLNSTKKSKAPSHHLLNVLKASQEAYNLTHGYFDISIRPLMLLWKTSTSSGKVPNEKELDNLSKKIGLSKILKIRNNNTIILKRKGSLEIGGIAKGYIIDQVYAFLKQHQLTSFLVEAAGDIRVYGKPENKDSWVVGISSTNKIKETVQLKSGEAIATSGKTYRFHTIKGVHYSHILNPKSLDPITHSNTSSVISNNATTADYLASAFNILTNKHEINEVLENYPSTALILFNDKETVFTSELFLNQQNINNEK